MAESFPVNSESSRKALHAYVDEIWDKCKYATWSVRLGEDRSIDQNALFHVFCTEWIAYKLGKHVKTVQKFELNGMKRTVKKMFLIEHPESSPWMIEVITDYTTGLQKKDYTSSSSWKVGEMFQVLMFMQNAAANQGCVLESRGEFKKLQRESMGQ